MNSPFSLTRLHYNLIGSIIIATIIINIAIFLTGHFLQVIGIFWFGVVASLVVQILAKILHLKINFEIAFGIGLFTLLVTHLILYPIWIFFGNNNIPLDTTIAYFAIIFLIGCVQQLLTSLIFIRYGN